MPKEAVRDGDHTTTGGRVLAWDGTDFISNNGKEIAFGGSLATCGECEGTFPVIASYDGWTHAGRNMVLDGDRVPCPCGKNRVIANGSDIWIEPVSGASGTSAYRPDPCESPASFAVSRPRYDEGFTLLDPSTGEPLSRQRYRIVTDSGCVIEGVTDQSGKTKRIETERAERFRVDV
ncbi:PAAR domain-containing protein [Candidatus Burkholderia verschuerenii]|uniref:PAAR domain-containing protein n=1 Tax=Candidatus Burkholderia verschuerenii TaxID=242163 RepID=UPI0012ED6C9D